MLLAYVSSPLNRAHDLRAQPNAIAELRARADCQVRRVRGDMIETAGALPLAHEGPASPEDVFLGLSPDGVPWFASLAAEEANLTGLRDIMLAGDTPAEELSVLAQARSLVHWHERHSFCANCGAKTIFADAGYRRLCAACGAEHFPRTDPVVIIAVCHGTDVLLGRQAAWPAGMYSALAGFVEPGETIEQAARREVWEEAGIRVGAVTYAQSQPWPFPSSLMIGLLGRALSRDITVDSTELEDARWFPAADLRMMLERRHPDGLTTPNPYAIAHQLVRAALGS